MHAWTLILLGTFLSLRVCGQGLSIDRVSPGFLALNIPVDAGMGYQVERSKDFVEWQLFGDRSTASRVEFDLGEERSLGFFRIRKWQIPGSPITIAIIGDSTAMNFGTQQRFFSGWGEGLPVYFGQNASVVNLAAPGETTVTFLQSSLSLALTTLQLLEPEFVLIQFGFLDRYHSVPEFQTTTDEFADNLGEIVSIIRGFGGTPILVTPVGRRLFGEDGQVIPWLEDRRQVVLSASIEGRTHHIDLNLASRQLFNMLGDEASAYISANESDTYHFSLEGAEVIAGLVVEELPGYLRAYLD